MIGCDAHGFCADNFYEISMIIKIPGTTRKTKLVYLPCYKVLVGRIHTTLRQLTDVTIAWNVGDARMRKPRNYSGNHH